MDPTQPNPTQYATDPTQPELPDPQSLGWT